MVGHVTRYERTVGRYMLFGAIGAGGMATVHIGRRVGAAGFARLVAIKRLHPHLAAEREVLHAFLDEARIAARVTHPNVVSIHDVVLDGDEVLLVMEYVPGRSLSLLGAAERKEGRRVPPAVAGAIALDLLRGLQAAHDARDERGRPLGVIHRDVSPHNVLVGTDGIARVLEFGIAKALGRLQTTATGAVKGKLAYMAPERLVGDPVTVSVDIYAAAMVVWEMLAGARYFDGPSDETMIPRVLTEAHRPLEGAELEAASKVLERAMQRTPADRHASASDLASALQTTLPIAAPEEVAAWVRAVACKELEAFAEAIEEIEQSSVPSPAPFSRKASFRGSPDIDAPATVREGASAHVRADATDADSNAAVISDPRPSFDRGARGSRARVGWALALTAAAGVAILASTGGLTASRSSASHVVAPPPATASALARVPEPGASGPAAPVSPPLTAAPVASGKVSVGARSGKRPAAPPLTPTGSPVPPTATLAAPEPEAPADRK